MYSLVCAIDEFSHMSSAIVDGILLKAHFLIVHY